MNKKKRYILENIDEGEFKLISVHSNCEDAEDPATSPQNTAIDLIIFRFYVSCNFCVFFVW